MNHFVTGDFKSPGRFLPDEEYGRALDCLVKACTDLFLIDVGSDELKKRKVLLGKRKVFPQKDWWFGCGGRMRPGETPQQSAQRLLSRELGIKSEAEADFVGAFSFVWGMREQLPQENGTADISVILSVELSQKEISAFKFDENEYSMIEWTCIEDILSGDFHPALKASCNKYLERETWRSLSRQITECSPNDINFEELGRSIFAYVKEHGS